MSPTLTEAVGAMRGGRLSSEALTAGYLERSRRHDARIRAWAFLDPERALAQARKADAALRAGAAAGALHGAPIAIKDIIYTRGVPTGMGSPIFEGFVPAYSAACVEALERAGAFVQGKTVTTELANRHPGPTANPWNTAFTPGGSSSGSAAAVAAGFTAAALGSQTRGSVIRPAVYCGVVGYKPSFGLVSRFGLYPQSETLDHVGVLTRSVEDAALLVACLAGHDPRDPGSLAEAPAHPDFAQLGELHKPPRLAAVRTPAWSAADEAQQRLFESNCAALRKAGASVVPVELPGPFDQAIGATRVLQLSEMARNYRDLPAERLSAGLRDLCEQGRRYSAGDYRDARELRERLREALPRVLEGFDAIVTPPATGEPPRSLESTGDARFCAIWTLCGVPSVAFPTGTGPNGLPMGLQVVGGYLDDRRALQVAKWCMRHLPFDCQLGF